MNIKLQNRGVWRHTFSLFMKWLNILVINVNINSHDSQIWRDTFCLFMKRLDILVISVNIKLQHREVWRDTFSVFIRNIFLSLRRVMTSLGVFPRYSWQYWNSASQMLTTLSDWLTNSTNCLRCLSQLKIKGGEFAQLQSYPRNQVKFCNVRLVKWSLA